MEILRQHQGPIDAIFVAIGGGGLISGIAAYVKAVRPEIQVIGVQMNDSDAMMRSVARRRARRARRRRPVLRRHRRQAGRRGDLPPRARAGRRLRSSSTPTRSAPRSRTCSRTRAASSSRPARSASPRSSSTSHAHAAARARPRRDHLRREHELRPPALRRRARRGRRGARGAVRGDDPRGARQLPALLRADRPARVTEFNYRISDAARGPRLRRRRRSVDRAESAQLARELREPRLRRRRPDRRRAGQGARAPHGRRPQPAGAATSGSTASSSPSGPAR